MKTISALFGLIFALFAFVGCSDDDDAPTEFTITAISPESGTVGSEITITGTDFPTDASQIDLTFGGTTATIVSVTSTQIVAEVPSGAVSGDVSIDANGLTKAATSNFTVLSELISGTLENLFAPQIGGPGQPQPPGGPFTKFSFETGDITDSETEWDIAFRATTIAVNGGTATGTNDEPERNGNAGATIIDGIFSDVTSTDGLTFAQDADGAFAIIPVSDQGWYNYNDQTRIVKPIPGKILVFRTHDGKYAKIEIKSYYKDAPAEPDQNNESRHYTFDYVYNPNEGETSLAQ